METATGAKAVAAEVAKLLRVGIDIVKRYGFIQQGAMRSVLFGQRAKRVEAFQKLVGADSAESARETLRHLINSIEAPDLTNDIVAAKEARDLVQGQLDDAETAAEAAAEIMRGIDYDALMLVDARKEEAYRASENEASLVQQEAIRRKERDDAQAALAEAEKNVEGWKGQVSQLEAPAAEAQEQLAGHQANCEAYKRYLAALSAWQAANAGVVAPMEMVAEADPPLLTVVAPETDVVAVARAKLQDLHDAVTLTRQAFEAAAASNIGECPVCGVECASCKANEGGEQAVAERAARVAGLFKEFDDATTGLKAATELVVAYDEEVVRANAANDNAKKAYEVDVARRQALRKSAHDVYALNVKNHQQRLKDTRKVLDACEVREEPVIDEQALQHAVHCHAEAKSHVASWGGVLASTRAATTRAQLAFEQTETYLAQARADIANAPTPEEVAEAGRLLQLYATNSATHTAVSKSIEQFKILLANREKVLSEFELRQQRNQGLRCLRSSLTTMRDVLHRDRLPSRIMAGYMQVLVARINELLPKFEADFLIFLDETEFMARKTDGTEIQASDLSGGEACRWCISFLLSVHQLFATDLGLLVLDEPTDGLDDAGKDAFGYAMKQLQDILRETKTQTFIATHARQLTVGAERVVDVAKLVSES